MLRRLDIVPRQVLIEVLVAEVMLGDDLKFGIEFSAAQDSRKGALGRITGESTTTSGSQTTNSNGTTNTSVTTSGSNAQTASIFDLGSALGFRSSDVVPVPGNGFFGVISDNRNFAAVLNAAAGKNKLKVLSSPHLMTADNHEAHILVGNEVPIITTQSNATNVQTNGTSNILQNIQYRDTGVIMTVLPQVNSEGLVNMQIRQEVSQIASATTGGIASPTFSTRESETTVVVQSGETIVIGGIIDDTVDRSRTGVPYLMDIPVIGRAFRVDTRQRRAHRAGGAAHPARRTRSPGVPFRDRGVPVTPEGHAARPDPQRGRAARLFGPGATGQGHLPARERSPTLSRRAE